MKYYSGFLGYAYLPQEEAGSVYDGIVLLFEVVGGRDMGFVPYDQGRTLVHEVGHYFGLLHTFEGYGCYDGYEAGDLIADTHSEGTDHYGCTQTYTCGTPDDIHNYMNYTDDLCMHEFTSEQANRTVCGLVNYRPLLFQMGTLTVDKAGGGTGTVTSDPAGINCGADCTENYPKGTVVTLTAHPGVNSYFVEWSGDCSGTGITTQVTVDADKTCTAIFGYPVGGVVVPVNKLELLALRLGSGQAPGLAALASLAALTVALVSRRRKTTTK